MFVLWSISGKERDSSSLSVVKEGTDDAPPVSCPSAPDSSDPVKRDSRDPDPNDQLPWSNAPPPLHRH